MSETFPQIILSTKNLNLVFLDEKHAHEVCRYSKSNKDFFAPYGPKPFDEYFTMEYQMLRLMEEQNLRKEKKSIRFWIFKKEDVRFEKIIGDVHFMNIVWGIFLSCHLGYKFDQAEVDKGYGTEAIGAAVDFMFSDWKLHRIQANIIPENKRSQRVVEKLGFVNEGLSKKYLKLNGEWKDHLHWVKLNESI